MTDEQRNIERSAQDDAIKLVQSIITSIEKSMQMKHMLPSVRDYYKAEWNALMVGRDAMIRARDQPEPPDPQKRGGVGWDRYGATKPEPQPGTARSAQDVLELLLTNPPEHVVETVPVKGTEHAAMRDKLHEVMKIYRPCPHCESQYVYGDVQTQHDGVISGALFCAGCGVLILRTLVD
jgi:hypothetical protein